MKKMFHIILILAVFAIMVFSLGTTVISPPKPVNDMSGSGTPGDPYIIYDVYDLQAMENDLTAHYTLGGDIDASATSDWNDGAGFEPVGTFVSGHPELVFSGSFDGRGFTHQFPEYRLEVPSSYPLQIEPGK
jgi:hypothetical protein